MSYAEMPLREQLDQLRRTQGAGIDLLLAAVEAFQAATKREIPMQHLVVFLTVGRYPGRSQMEYARMLGSQYRQSTISRHLTDLSIQLRTREPGYGLIRFETDLMNRRQLLYHLTPKGVQLYRKINSLMGAQDNVDPSDPY